MSVRSLKVKKESFKALDAWTSGPHVILAYRDSDGEKTTKTIKDFGYGRWYFYIAKSDLPKIKDKIDDLKNGDIDVIENEVRFEEEGNWVKVFVHNGNINERYTERTDDRVRLKTLFERSGVKVYEADLKLHKRYCIDNKVETSDDYRVLYYDIETDDRNNGIQMSRDRILTIACMDQNGTVCFFHDENEKEMLLRFYNYVKDFDIMVGYNSDNFDKPYILKRLGVHFLEKEAQYFKYRIAHIDLMQLFIKRFAGDSDITSWSLDFISKYFLGHGKVEGVKFGNGVGYKLYRDNFEKFMEYNIGDARNLYELNQALSIVDQVILECQICGAFPSKFSISEILDSYILKSVHGKGVHFASINYTQHQIRCPQCNHTNDSEVPLDEIIGEFVCSRCSHKFDVNDTEEIVGAHVFEPVAGLHDNVYVFDYKALYPSIIRTWNIGPDTFIEDGDDYDKFITSANDCKFTCPTEKLSSIKSAIENLLNLRKVYKDKMNEYEDGSGEYKAYKAKQNAVKLLCNSMYGLMGYQYGRFYRKEIAEAITLGGQWLNKHTKKWFEGKGVEVIYGDSVTDDRMLLVKDYKGLIRNITFRELWDSSSEEVESNGKRYRNNVPFETISRSHTELSFEPIKYIVAHEVNKNIYRVWNNKGETCITEDHSLIDSTLTKRKFDEIDTLFTVKNEISSLKIKTIHTVDIVDYLGDNQVKCFGRSNKRFVYDNDYVWLETVSKDKYYKPRESKFKIKRYYSNDCLESLCRIIGFYVSEGSTSTPETNKVRFMSSFSNNNREYLEQIEGDIGNMTIGFTPCYTLIGNTYNLAYGAQLLAVILSRICGQKSVGKKLPDFVFNLNDSCKSLVLDWLVKGDGSRETNERYSDEYKINNFRYDSTSKVLINNISCLISMLGYTFSIKYRESKKSWCITTSQYNRDKPVKHELVEYDGDVYDIEVGENHNFFDTFGFIGLHNTDSVFVKADADFRGTIDDLLNELHVFYNDILFEYFGVKKHFIELEYEKCFKRILLLKKKHYVGNIIELDGHKTDKMVIKGMECIKRDTIPLGKRWQRDLIEMLIREEHDAYFYAKWITEKMGLFFNGEIAIEDITIKKKLTKSPKSYKTLNAHVKVAKEMLEKEMECYVGMQIPYIIIDHSPMVAVHPDWYKGNASMEYYWDLQIFGILKRPLQCAFPDYDWDQYSTKVVSKREKRKEQFIKWFNDPKKKKDKLLEKLNADKMLSDVDRNEIKVKSNIKLKRVMKIKK